MNTTIRQRESGKYQAIISYKSQGKWKQKSKGGFDKASDAKKWAKEETFNLVDKERQGIIDSDMILAEFFEIYKENSKTVGKTINTIKLENQTINFFYKFKNVKLINLNSFEIKNYILKKQKLTGCQYDMYFKLFKSMLNFAKDELKIIFQNPLNDIKINFVSEDKRIKFITKELYNDILKSAKNEKYKLFIQTAYKTGMRVGEILGITIFDIKNHSINVNKQFAGREKKFINLKTKNSYRTIPISLELEKKLLNSSTDIEGRVFFDVHFHNIYWILKKFNTSIHCFRHTFATNLISSGIDLTVVSQIIGDNIETIMKIYTELNKDLLNSEMEKVRNIF